MSKIGEIFHRAVFNNPIINFMKAKVENSTAHHRNFYEYSDIERALVNIYYIGEFVAALVIIICTGYIMKKLYALFFIPMNRVRCLGSVGYENPEICGTASKKEIANLVRRRRKIGRDLPPVFPNGWFRVIDSVQLGKGCVKEVTMLGKNLAVFRGENGKVTVMNTYCAHMGGNLGTGGVVIGNRIQCPFHGWVFGQDGKCEQIPYSGKSVKSYLADRHIIFIWKYFTVPSSAKVKTWPSREINGVIFMWYHCDELEPQWEIPEIKEITNKDIPENGSDLAHLSHLHLPSIMCGIDIGKMFRSWIKFAEHVFKVSPIGSSIDTPHISSFYMTHWIDILKKWKFFHMKIHVDQIGPGMVHLHIDTPLGKGVFVQTLTPVEPLHQVLIHSLYATWKMPIILSKFVLLGEAMQVERDVMVWNNKTFAAKPMLVKEESLILKYRRWFSQFYSENSVRLTTRDNETLDW